MTGPVTTEALVESLTTFIMEHSDYVVREQAAWRAEELVKGPLAPLLAAHQQVTAERDEARDLAYELKLAAAGGEDVPGSANLVTPEDVRRWRDEDACQLARLRAEGEAKDRALKPFADYADFAERHEWPKDIAEDPTTPVLGRAGWDGEIACEITVGDFQAARAATAREGA